MYNAYNVLKPGMPRRSITGRLNDLFTALQGIAELHLCLLVQLRYDSVLGHPVLPVKSSISWSIKKKCFTASSRFRDSHADFGC